MISVEGGMHLEAQTKSDLLRNKNTAKRIKLQWHRPYND